MSAGAGTALVRALPHDDRASGRFFPGAALIHLRKRNDPDKWRPTWINK